MPDIKYSNQNRQDSCHQTYTENSSKFKSNFWLSCKSLYICKIQSCKFCIVFNGYLYNRQLSLICFLELFAEGWHCSCSIYGYFIQEKLRLPLCIKYFWLRNKSQHHKTICYQKQAPRRKKQSNPDHGVPASARYVNQVRNRKGLSDLPAGSTIIQQRIKKGKPERLPGKWQTTGSTGFHLL